MDWYYIDKSKPEGKRRNGPWSSRQMLCFAEQGAFTPETPVWHKDFENWRPWSECENSLKAEFQVDAIRQVIEEKILPNINIAQVNYASFWQRACAFFIDSFILQAILLLLKPLYPQFGFISQITEQTTLNDLTPMLLFMFNLMLLYEAFFIKNFSGTPGKILLRISVIRAGGKEMTWSCAFVRAFTSIFSSSFFGIGCLLAAIDPERRALHDFAADTRVIKL